MIVSWFTVGLEEVVLLQWQVVGLEKKKILGSLKTDNYLTLSFDTRHSDQSCYICMPDAFPSAQEIYYKLHGLFNLCAATKIIQPLLFLNPFLSIPIILKSSLYIIFAYTFLLVAKTK